MRDFLTDFLDRFQYPDEAKKVLIDCYDAMANDEIAMSVMKKHIDIYTDGGDYDHSAMLADTTREALRIGKPWQTSHLVMGILLSKILKKKYEEKGIDEQFWIDSVDDFKCKLFECHDVYHVWGSFVGHWWKYFFSMEIIGIGRLQFQMRPFGYEYKDENIHLTPDMKALAVHIPSSGPLTKELCEDSYSRAMEFFKPYFGDQKVLFMCDSWLLYPDNEEMLPNSNIVRFMKDFKVFKIWEPQKPFNIWTVFGDSYMLPFELLPRNTTLRRAYAERLCNGQRLGVGIGFFIR